MATTRWGIPHTVELWCTCADIENCTFERYISEIRLLRRELDEALRKLDDLRDWLRRAG